MIKNCRNMNHGRSGIIPINFCPECGHRFEHHKVMACRQQRHAELLKQRFKFCIDCGGKLTVV